ncbi:MAG: type II secretion system protein [Candidatus Eremiobacterota bacterium]
MKQKYSARGFSLIEIMTAIGIMGIVIVTVCGVFVHGLDAIKKSKFRACAIRIANQKFSELNKADLGDPNGIPLDKLSLPDPNGYIEGLEHCAPTGFQYISWQGDADSFELTGKQSMDNVPYTFNMTIANFKSKNNIKQVTVKITWSEVEGEKKIELCTLISRSM